MKFVKIMILAVLIAASMADSSEAGWLIYHKPEFKGKVIDAETKLPIEGVVIVVVYNKTTMGLGAGTISSIINVRETLTDKDGTFRIPSYTTIIQPFSWSSRATFIVFKPGYASISGLSLEETLSKDMDKKEVEWPWLYNKDVKFKFAPGLIGLPRLKSREERLKVSVSPVEDSEHSGSWYWKKQKLLIKAIREEWQYLYDKDSSNLYRWEDN